MANNWKLFPIIGAVTVLAVLPIVVELGSILDTIILIFILVILGQSFNILGGYTGLMNLGLSAFFGTGALATRFLWILGVPIYISLLAGGVASAIVAIIIGFPSLRLRGAYFAIGTLALTMISYIVTSNIFIVASLLPVEELTTYSVLSRYYLSLAFAIIASATVYRLTNSKLGMGMISIRENEDTARSLGINVFRCKLKAFIISALLAGFAGGLFAYYHASYYHYQPFYFLWSFEPILATFIGGVGTIMGPITGCIFYLAVKEMFVVTIGAPHVIVFGIIFILVVLLSPEGLVGGIRRLYRFLVKSMGIQAKKYWRVK